MERWGVIERLGTCQLLTYQLRSLEYYSSDGGRACWLSLSCQSLYRIYSRKVKSY